MTQLEKMAMESGISISLSSLPTPVTNFMSSLVTSKRIADADNSDLQRQVHLLRLSNDTLQTSNKQLNAAVFSSEQDAAGARVKVRRRERGAKDGREEENCSATLTPPPTPPLLQLESANKQHKQHVSKLTSERDEYRSLSVRLSSRDEQYKATVRKMEVDYDSLRKQLQKRVQQERKGSNAFKPFDTKGKLPTREKGKAQGGDKEFLSKLNSSLEMRQSELLYENNR